MIDCGDGVKDILIRALSLIFQLLTDSKLNLASLVGNILSKLAEYFPELIIDN